MRGKQRRQETMFSYVATEARVPERHALRTMVDQVHFAPRSSQLTTLVPFAKHQTASFHANISGLQMERRASK